MAKITLQHNASEVVDSIHNAVENALTKASIFLADEISARVRSKGGTGQLARSIKAGDVEMDGDKGRVEIGSPLKYAIYQEYGTGTYAESGKGRKGWWVYVESSEGNGISSGKEYSFEEAKRIMAILKSKGLDAHITQGVKPQKMFRNAFKDNQKQIQAFFAKELEGVS